MDAHINRMITEKKELAEKLQRLEEFIVSDKFPSLNKFQKYLLEKQKDAMEKYLDILTTRITSDTFVMESTNAKVEDATVESSEHN